MTILSGGVLAVMLLAGLAAPILAPYDPTAVQPVERLQAPSTTHWFGTDDLGRDVFSRALYGARVSLLVGLVVTLGAGSLGSVLGLLAGYDRRLDGLIMRLLDGLLAFPSILLAIALLASLGPRVSSVVIALTVVYTPLVARQMRGATLAVRHLPFVEAARAVGVPSRLILWRYVFRNALSPLLVQAVFVLAYAIIAEASLSFIGAGVDPETASWGNMLRDGQRLLSRAWWIALAPGTLLFLTVLAANVLGDGLRDILDPRSRFRRAPTLR
jgi:peptide/nickel transport system permease protein